ncbi:MAG: hypothetical protein LBR26_10895 [Prevotella sp.]|jgi:hypothetical protein|nr:hypothetical protein [Prevotella sp.]
MLVLRTIPNPDYKVSSPAGLSGILYTFNNLKRQFDVVKHSQSLRFIGGKAISVRPRLKAFHIPAWHDMPDEMNMPGNYVLSGQYNTYPQTVFVKINIVFS